MTCDVQMDLLALFDAFWKKLIQPMKNPDYIYVKRTRLAIC